MWQGIPKVHKCLFGENEQLKAKIKWYNKTFPTIEIIKSKLFVEQIEEF